jgi:hypothetical protein
MPVNLCTILVCIEKELSFLVNFKSDCIIIFLKLGSSGLHGLSVRNLEILLKTVFSYDATTGRCYDYCNILSSFHATYANTICKKSRQCLQQNFSTLTKFFNFTTFIPFASDILYLITFFFFRCFLCNCNLLILYC